MSGIDNNKQYDGISYRVFELEICDHGLFMKDPDDTAIIFSTEEEAAFWIKENKVEYFSYGYVILPYTK